MNTASLIWFLLSALAPVAFGTTFMAILFKTSTVFPAARSLIILSSGTYLGHMSFVAILYLFPEQPINPFPIWNTLIVVSWLLLTVFTFFSVSTKQVQPVFISHLRQTWGSTSATEKLLGTFLLAWLGANVFFITQEVALRPAVAWDSVSYWAQHPLLSLDLLESDSQKAQRGLFQRHPNAGPWLNALSMMTSRNLLTAHFLYASWLLNYIAIVALAAGITLIISKSRLISMIVPLLLSTLPILESHTALGGYVDTWVALGIISAISVFFIATSRLQFGFAVLIYLLTVFSLLLLKSSLVTYLPIFLLLMITLLASHKTYRKYAYILLLFFALTAFVAATKGFSITIGDRLITFDPNSWVLKVAWYEGTLTPRYINEALQNSSSIFLSNSTYGLTLLVFVASLPALTYLHFIHRARSVPELLNILLSILLILHLLYGMATTTHLMATGSPERDTGASRFLLPWSVATMILLGSLCPYRRTLPSTSIRENVKNKYNKKLRIME